MFLCLFINVKMPTIVGSLTFMSRKTKSYSGDLSMILITSERGQESDKPTFPLLDLVTLKAPTKIAADDNLISYFYLSKKIRLDFCM